VSGRPYSQNCEGQSFVILRMDGSRQMWYNLTTEGGNETLPLRPREEQQRKGEGI